jgi:hypothetical protein
MTTNPSIDRRRSRTPNTCLNGNFLIQLNGGRFQRKLKKGMVGMEGDLIEGNVIEGNFIEGNFKDIFRRGFLSSIKFIL